PAASGATGRGDWTWADPPSIVSPARKAAMERSDKTAREMYEAVKTNPSRKRFGFGRKPMLVNIDLQKSYTEVDKFATAYETDPKQVDYVNELSDLARARNLPLVWTYAAYL